MTVITSATADDLATSVATRLLDTLAAAQAGDAVPQIALTGGTIADAIHREVGRLSPGTSVDWTRVVVWWGDERYVAADSPDRNAGQARAAFLGAVGVPAANVHEMPSTDDAFADVDEAATAYGNLMRAHGSDAFELVMLGMGPDGHVASLFPGFPQLDVDDRIAVGVTGSPKPPPQRISLTFAALNRTRAVWFLVSGSGKADAVAHALGGADRHQIPAAGVHGHEETLWLLDEAAASRL